MTEAARKREGVPALHFPFRGVQTLMDRLLEVFGAGEEAEGESPSSCDCCGAQSDLLWDIDAERWCPACVRDKARREGVLG